MTQKISKHVAKIKNWTKIKTWTHNLKLDTVNLKLDTKKIKTLPNKSKNTVPFGPCLFMSPLYCAHENVVPSTFPLRRTRSWALQRYWFVLVMSCTAPAVPLSWRSMKGRETMPWSLKRQRSCPCVTWSEAPAGRGTMVWRWTIRCPLQGLAGSPDSGPQYAQIHDIHDKKW